MKEEILHHSSSVTELKVVKTIEAECEMVRVESGVRNELLFNQQNILQTDKEILETSCPPLGCTYPCSVGKFHLRDQVQCFA